jgi:hypothetical protein
MKMELWSTALGSCREKDLVRVFAGFAGEIEKRGALEIWTLELREQLELREIKVSLNGIAILSGHP